MKSTTPYLNREGGRVFRVVLELNGSGHGERVVFTESTVLRSIFMPLSRQCMVAIVGKVAVINKRRAGDCTHDRDSDESPQFAFAYPDSDIVIELCLLSVPGPTPLVLLQENLNGIPQSSIDSPHAQVVQAIVRRRWRRSLT